MTQPCRYTYSYVYFSHAYTVKVTWIKVLPHRICTYIVYLPLRENWHGVEYQHYILLGFTKFNVHFKYVSLKKILEKVSIICVNSFLMNDWCYMNVAKDLYFWTFLKHLIRLL